MKLGAKITEHDAAMLRQVHPKLFVDGRPSSQVFVPKTADDGLLSVHQGGLITAQAAYTNHVNAGWGSCGVVSILVSECSNEGLDVVEAPLSTTEDPVDSIDDPAHACVDFRGLTGNQCEKRGRKLARVCWARGFIFQPTETPSVQVPPPQPVSAQPAHTAIVPRPVSAVPADPPSEE